MIIKLLLATSDNDYLNFLSRVLSDHYASTFEVSACSSTSRLEDIVERQSFDVALLDEDAIESIGTSAARMTLLLQDNFSEADCAVNTLEQIKKYQRISSITAQILERYAEVYTAGRGSSRNRGRITVVWSPIGGSGKTTVALAYATWLVSQGKKAIYLDLEPFASTGGVFAKTGKSLSTLFEKMESDTGLLVQSILQTDPASGVCYFSPPENYDDVRVLSPDDVESIALACAKNADELVVDLGSVYDKKTRRLFQLADSVFLVSDGSPIGNAKLEQFFTQHSEYEQITRKITRIANKGSRADLSAGGSAVMLPMVQSPNPAVVFKNLSAGYFQAMN